MWRVQIFDMLIAAGVAYSDDTLGELFNASHLSKQSFDTLYLEMKLQGPARLSYTVLAKCSERMADNSIADAGFEDTNAIRILDLSPTEPITYNVGMKGLLLALEQSYDHTEESMCIPTYACCGCRACSSGAE